MQRAEVVFLFAGRTLFSGTTHGVPFVALNKYIYIYIWRIIYIIYIYTYKYVFIYIYFFEKRVSFLVRRTIRNPSLYQTWRFRTVMIHLGEAPIVGGRRHYLIDVLPLRLGESRVWLITGLINPNLNLLFHYPMIYPWNIPSSPEFASAKALFCAQQVRGS